MQFRFFSHQFFSFHLFPLRLLLLAAAVVAGTLLPAFSPLLQLVFSSDWGWLCALFMFALALLCLVGRAWVWAWMSQPKLGFVLLMLAAMSYGHWYVQSQLTSRLPIAADRVQTTLMLQVQRIEAQGFMDKLQVAVKHTPAQLQELGLPPLRQLRLNIYHRGRATAAVQVGQTLEADVVLRSPRNLSNGLAFDYQAWLLGQGVDGTGYIRQWRPVDSAPTLQASLRQQFLHWAQAQYSPEHWPWIAGLVFGEQSAFSAEQWQLAKTTGTLHLLVVSGLHMGMVVLLGLLLWGALQRMLVLILRRNLPAMLGLRAVFLLALTAGYLWLAGAGVALQRAWLMLAVLLVLHNSRWHISWLAALSCALLTVLLVNPLAWVNAGFGYSFLAVGALILYFSKRTTHWLNALWLPQWVVFVAMLPLFLWWQQPVSVQQVFANLLAIPYLNLVLMPLTFLSLIPKIPVAELLLWAGDVFWQGLEFITQFAWPTVWTLPWQTLLLWPVWLLLMHLGVSRLLAFVGLALVLVVVFTQPVTPRSQARLLDVGQGQSIVFTTAHSTLVYDTGPFMGELDSGEAIVTPVLRQLGVRRIDSLVVSHADNDHAGGTGALLKNFPVVEFHAGQALPKLPRQAQLCAQFSNSWQVLDEQLWYRYFPVAETAWAYLPDNPNNRSCVMQVQWHGVRFLLVGDIAKAVEYQLLRQYGSALQSDILLLGHHGSDTSSSEVFLQTVAPKQVWISAGFNNRYQHPHAAVVQRLEALDIPWVSTAEQGSLWLAPNSHAFPVFHTQRQQWQPPWRSY